MNPRIQGSSAFTASPSITQTESKTKIITTSICTKKNYNNNKKPNSEHQHPGRDPQLHCLTFD